MKITDMPKLQSPFVRNEKTKWKVIDEVTEGYEWVFEDESVMAIEKLDGTNVSILIQGGAVTGIWNRENRITMFSQGNEAIMKGLTNSSKQIAKLLDGQHFGELIGPGINGNSYKLDDYAWIPFETFSQKHLKYKCWGKYPKTFESISEWFKELMPLYTMMRGDKEGFVEGIVFTHPDGRMAKLRCDMFDWFKGRGHKQ